MHANAASALTMAKPWSMYRPPIEHYEIGDVPEMPTDPVGKIFRLLGVFIALQALNLLGLIALWLR